MRNLLVMSIVAIGLISSGCCGPIGCGTGCGTQYDDCNNCCGGFGPQTIPYGPLDGLRQMRRSLVCGGGCGETYYGEWRSTPPDAYDPCCGDRFVGGATKCTPFCGIRGPILPRLYGKRFCDSCGVSADACGCDSGCDSGCSGGCDGGCNGGCDGGSSSMGTVIESDGPIMSEQAPMQTSPSGCNCASCSKGSTGPAKPFRFDTAKAQPLPNGRPARTAQRMDTPVRTNR